LSKQQQKKKRSFRLPKERKRKNFKWKKSKNWRRIDFSKKKKKHQEACFEQVSRSVKLIV